MKKIFYILLLLLSFLLSGCGHGHSYNIVAFKPTVVDSNLYNVKIDQTGDFRFFYGEDKEATYEMAFTDVHEDDIIPIKLVITSKIDSSIYYDPFKIEFEYDGSKFNILDDDGIADTVPHFYGDKILYGMKKALGFTVGATALAASCFAGYHEETINHSGSVVASNGDVYNYNGYTTYSYVNERERAQAQVGAANIAKETVKWGDDDYIQDRNVLIANLLRDRILKSDVSKTKKLDGIMYIKPLKMPEQPKILTINLPSLYNNKIYKIQYEIY